MKRFIFAIALVWLAVFVWNLQTGWGGRLALQYRMLLGNTVILAPISAASLITILYNHLRPRRLFLKESHGTIRIIVMGVVTAVVSMFISMFAVAYFDSYVHESFIVFGCVALSTWLAIRLMPRYAPGVCAACHYDIRASLAAGRCPECGLAF